MSEPGELNRNQFAEFCGVTPAAITRAKKEGKVRRTEGHLYSIFDSVNREYVRLRLIREHRQRRADGDASEEGAPDEGAALDNEKTREEILRIREARIGLELKNARERQDLIPEQDVRLWIGAFATGIRNNFLRLGERIARGDNTLRDKIERETQRSLQKTLDNAAAQLRDHMRDIEDIVSGDDEPEKPKRKRAPAKRRASAKAKSGSKAKSGPETKPKSEENS